MQCDERLWRPASLEKKSARETVNQRAILFGIWNTVFTVESEKNPTELVVGAIKCYCLSERAGSMLEVCSYLASSSKRHVLTDYIVLEFKFCSQWDHHSTDSVVKLYTRIVLLLSMIQDMNFTVKHNSKMKIRICDSLVMVEIMQIVFQPIRVRHGLTSNSLITFRVTCLKSHHFRIY